MYLVWLGKNVHYVLSCGSNSRTVLAAPRSLLRVPGKAGIDTL